MKSFNLKTIFMMILQFTPFFSTMLLVGCNSKHSSQSTPMNNDQNDPSLCTHEWTDADCTAPKTCKACGATEGDALGHNWVDATTTAPKTCTRCGATEGSPASIIPDDKNLVLGLEKIPIANSSMTEDELRDLVVAFMKLQLTYAYTPDFGGPTQYQYYIKNLRSAYGFEGCKISFQAGKYYGGVPYMGNAAGNLYRWLPFYDAETGVMDWTPILNSRRLNWVDGNYTYPDVASAVFGNSCSSSCFWAWSRVSNKIQSCWTSGWTPQNGFVKVGDYKLSDNNDLGSSTKTICKNNGTEVMYRAYASTKRADGMVQTGHAVMIVADPVVVYNADGSINGDKSYLCIAEQKASFLTTSPSNGGVPLYSPLNNFGDTYRIMGNFWGTTVNGKIKDMEWSFAELYEKGFLPFTAPELVGLDPVEKATATISHKKSTVTLDELYNIKVTSNYAISDVNFSVKDDAGNETYIGMFGKTTGSLNGFSAYSLSTALNNNIIYSSPDFIRTELAKYSGNGYTLIITCRVSTGELLTVYTGKLVK